METVKIILLTLLATGSITSFIMFFLEIIKSYAKSKQTRAGLTYKIEAQTDRLCQTKYVVFSRPSSQYNWSEYTLTHKRYDDAIDHIVSLYNHEIIAKKIMIQRVGSEFYQDQYTLKEKIYDNA